MDWSSLRDFLALSELGSISAAARALGVSQPALSRRLQKLEEALDVELFVRSQRGMRLTAAGERVRALAQRMQDAAQHIPSAADLGHDRVSGVVRISAPEARLGTDWLQRALLPLRESCPEILIELTVDNQLTDLGQRQADIALRLVKPTDPALTARKVASVAWGLYAASGYLRSRARITTPADLREHDLLVYEQGQDTRQTQWLERYDLANRIVLRANSIDAIYAAARAGWGVALLPIFSAQRTTQLDLVLAKPLERSMSLWLVTHADLRKSRRIRTVFRLLAQAFERDQQRFSELRSLR